MTGSMTRRQFLAGTAAAVAAPLVGCADEARMPLRVAMNSWPGYEPLYTARALGLLPEDAIRLIEMPSTTEAMRIFRSRDLDVLAVTLDEALLLASQRQDISIVLVADYSEGGDSIIGKPPLADVTDLRGKRIGVEDTALGAYMLSRALALHSLAPTEVVTLRLPLDQHEAAFLSNKIDAVVTFEPTRSRLLGHGAVELFSSREIPGEVVDILVVHSDLLPGRLEDVRLLYRTWTAGLVAMHRDPDQAMRRLEERLGLKPGEGRRQMSMIRVPDSAECRQLLMGLEPPLYKTMLNHLSFMVSHGLLVGPIDITRMFRNVQLIHG